jgi:PqqA peptide cyclase
VNLITSGIGLTEPKLDALIDAGLDHLQLSFQDADEAPANEFAGARAHARKLALAEIVRARQIGFTLNAVVHRRNLDRLDDIVAMAERLGVDRLEIANVQYYGWAIENREKLMPTRRQLDACVASVRTHQERLKGRMRIDFVPPDYYARYPKACMGGWGRSLMLVDPAGFVTAVPRRGVIPDLTVRQRAVSPLRWIWEESAAFQRFRGEDWMPEPCRSCDRRQEDFGGCRCQALLLTGNASATDPVCSLAPDRKAGGCRDRAGQRGRRQCARLGVPHRPRVVGRRHALPRLLMTAQGVCPFGGAGLQSCAGSPEPAPGERSSPVSAVAAAVRSGTSPAPDAGKAPRQAAYEAAAGCEPAPRHAVNPTEMAKLHSRLLNDLDRKIRGGRVSRAVLGDQLVLRVLPGRDLQTVGYRRMQLCHRGLHADSLCPENSKADSGLLSRRMARGTA